MHAPDGGTGRGRRCEHPGPPLAAAHVQPGNSLSLAHASSLLPLLGFCHALISPTAPHPNRSSGHPYHSVPPLTAPHPTPTARPPPAARLHPGRSDAEAAEQQHGDDLVRAGWVHKPSHLPGHSCILVRVCASSFVSRVCAKENRMSALLEGARVHVLGNHKEVCMLMGLCSYRAADVGWRLRPTTCYAVHARMLRTTARQCPCRLICRVTDPFTVWPSV